MTTMFCRKDHLTLPPSNKDSHSDPQITYLLTRRDLAPNSNKKLLEIQLMTLQGNQLGCLTKKTAHRNLKERTKSDPPSILRRWMRPRGLSLARCNRWTKHRTRHERPQHYKGSRNSKSSSKCCTSMTQKTRKIRTMIDLVARVTKLKKSRGKRINPLSTRVQL